MIYLVTGIYKHLFAKAPTISSLDAFLLKTNIKQF